VRDPIEHGARVVLFSDAEEFDGKRHREAFLIGGKGSPALFIPASSALMRARFT
jgi:hypothetical protein